MVSSCCVTNCKNRYRKGEQLRLFRFPFPKPQRLAIWVRNIKKFTKTGEIWEPKRYDRVCSSHFITERPVDDAQHPDYAPNINLGYERSSPETDSVTEYVNNSMADSMADSVTESDSQETQGEIIQETMDRTEAVSGLQALSSLPHLTSSAGSDSPATEENCSIEKSEKAASSGCSIFSENSACALIKKLVHRHGAVQTHSDSVADRVNPDTGKAVVTPNIQSCVKTASSTAARAPTNGSHNNGNTVYPDDPAQFSPSPFQDHQGPPDPVNRIERLRLDPLSEAPAWEGRSPFNKRRGRPAKEGQPPEKKTMLLPNKYTPSGIVDFSALQQKEAKNPAGKTEEGFATKDVQLRMLEMKVKSLENEADLFRTMRDFYKQQMSQLQLQTKKLEEQMENNKFSYRKTKEHCHLYTGLTQEMFAFLLDQLEPEIFNKFSAISSEDLLLLTMMRLRLNLPVKELALRFDINSGSVLRYLEAMIPALRKSLEKHISWTDHVEYVAHGYTKVPQAFKISKCSGVNSVVGCLEVTLKTTKLFESYRNHSKFKDQDSVKFLIATTPTGEVTFTSRGKGGNSTELTATIESGYLSQLNSWDQILTDIPLQEHCSVLGVKCFCPTMTKVGEEVICPDPNTPELRKLFRKSWGATVERMQNFAILSSKCPFGVVKYLDDVVVIVAAIVNLQKRREDKKMGRKKKNEEGEMVLEECPTEDRFNPETGREGLNTDKLFLTWSQEDSLVKENTKCNVLDGQFTIMLGSFESQSNDADGKTLIVTKNEKNGTLTIKNENDGTVTVLDVDERLVSNSVCESESVNDEVLVISEKDENALAVDDNDEHCISNTVCSTTQPNNLCEETLDKGDGTLTLENETLIIQSEKDNTASSAEVSDDQIDIHSHFNLNEETVVVVKEKDGSLTIKKDLELG